VLSVFRSLYYPIEKAGDNIGMVHFCQPRVNPISELVLQLEPILAEKAKEKSNKRW